ncbi:MAG TPA: hypothetical protein VGK87_00205 [Anaerolineae bacterium]
MIGKIVHLEPFDDIAGVRDRIEWARADRVVLVLNHEPGSRHWSAVDFDLTRRAGQQHGCEVAIVAARYGDRQLAGDAGLVTFRTVHQAINRRWIGGDEVEPVERTTPPRRFAPSSLRRFFPRRNWLLLGARVILLVVTAVIIAAAGLVVVPTAKVIMTASSQSIDVIVPVTLDAQIDKVDTDARKIPAHRIDVVVEDTGTATTTGAKDIPKGKARGSVMLFNVLSTPFKVPKNTVVRTSSASVAIRFITLNDVEVPPAGRTEVAVEALDEGPSGNVPSNQINQIEGMSALAVRVLNTQPTNGGGLVTVHAVTLDDYKRARAATMDKLLQTALSKMKQDGEVLRNGWYVVPTTIFIADVQDETYDRFVTEQADQVKLNLRLQVAGLAVDPADMDSIAQTVIADKVPAGYSLLDVTTERGDVAEEGTGLRTEFYVTAHGRAGAKIDENEVKKLVRGRTIADAQAVLLQNLSLKGNPQITVEPDWLLRYSHRMPFITLRIDTSVKRE